MCDFFEDFRGEQVDLDRHLFNAKRTKARWSNEQFQKFDLKFCIRSFVW